MASHLRPPDLEMQVRTQSEHGRTRLVYTLHSPTGVVGLSHHAIAGPFFQGSPEEFHRHLLHKIDQLGDLLDTDGSPLLPRGADRKLVSFGRALWRDLIPPELRSVYREIRESVQSWMIISDEPWIPWELIKPYEASGSGGILDDDFLALRFEVTRWLAGESTPAREITIRSFAALRTADLPQAGEERRLLDDLARSSGAAGKAPAFDSAGELLSYLETCGVQLLHFMGHGSHTAAHADESGIPLPDGSVFRPLDLEGPVATQVRRNQPLVFLNTCWAGQQGWSLTRLGGWAFRWVHVCGCSAFVAPLWPVRDQIALSFARAFYGALAGGAPLGEAAREARRQVHQERPGDPSVLAYAVYGHPYARVRFGGFSTAEESLSVLEAPTRRPIQWTARRRWWRSRWIWAAAAVILLVLATTARRIRESWSLGGVPNKASSLVLEKPAPVEPRKEQAAEPIQTAERKPEGKPPATPVSPSEKKTQSTTAATETLSTAEFGGIDFEITAALGVPKSKLKGALRSVAAPLAGMGISGWTLHLDVDPPRITPHTQDGYSSETCRLVARCSARRQGTSTSLDLGTASVDNAQDDGAIACEEAAQALAQDVIYRLVSSIRKGEI